MAGNRPMDARLPRRTTDNSALLARNVFAGSPEGEGPARLATYMRRALDDLSEQSGFDRGEISFPDPEQVSVNA
jgi:hypothetical protein